jgi:hypothetical protein
MLCEQRLTFDAAAGSLRQDAYLRVYVMRLVPPSQLPTTIDLFMSPHFKSHSAPPRAGEGPMVNPPLSSEDEPKPEADGILIPNAANMGR